MSSNTETRPSVMTRLRLENWSLPVKLGAVVLVPILLALTLGGLRIADQTHSATDLAARDRYVDLEGQVAAVVEQLQAERDQAAVFVAGNRSGDINALHATFGAVDASAARLQSSVGDPNSLGGSSPRAYNQVKGSLGGLAQLRGEVSNQLDTIGVISNYTGIIGSLNRLDASLDRQLDTPEQAGLASGLGALAEAREQVALQHAVIAVAIAKDLVSPTDADTVRAADAQLGSAIDQFRASLTLDQQNRWGGFVLDQSTNQFQALKQAALSRVGGRGQLGISAGDWDNAYRAATSDMDRSGDGIRSQIVSASTQQQASARNAAGLNSVILLLAVLAAATVVFLVGRSLLRPLRTLRHTALDVAERRLPRALEAMRSGQIPDTRIDPVPVTSTEEIGQVARAFDEVHGQAVSLAAEQATLQANVSNMFVNLSRRSQTLVERQLQLIERLERNEQDSDQLANLFQLDHLATRMRRNSENLLVLAGSDLGKRAGQHIAVVDVLRAAVSEIEQYQRVVVQQPPALTLTGRAGNDLVHLVAELLDNATTFSAPQTQVVVSSTRTSDDTLLIEIADQGVGMAGPELISYNNRLAGQSEMDVSASRRMGLFVVGRLAARHGVGVRLASSDLSGGGSSGVTVSVNVPSGLINASGAQPDAPAVRTHAPAAGRNGSALLQRTPRAQSQAALSEASAGAVPGQTRRGTPADRASSGPGTPGRTAPDGTAPDRAVSNGTPSNGPASDGTGPKGTGPDRASSGRPGAGGGAAANGGSGAAATGSAQPPARAAGAVPTGQPGRNGANAAQSASAVGAVLGGTPGERSGARPRPEPDARPTERSAPTRRQGQQDQPDAGQRVASPRRPDRREELTPRDRRTDQPRVDDRSGDRRADQGVDALWQPNTPPAAAESAPHGHKARWNDVPASRGGRAQPMRQSPPERVELPENPIFEETSAWFRENWVAPDSTDSDHVWNRPPDLSPARGDHREDRAHQPRDDQRSSASAAEQGSGRPDELTAPGSPGDRAYPLVDTASVSDGTDAAPDPWAGAVRGEAPHHEPAPEPRPEAWADSSLLDPMPEEPTETELTAAGLPKRTPRAQLIPGGPGSAPGGEDGEPAGVPRSAEQVRGRLASYQSGVRQGRENRLRRLAETSNGRSGVGHDTATHNGKENG